MSKLFPNPSTGRAMWPLAASLAVSLVWSILSLVLTLTFGPLPWWAHWAGTAATLLTALAAIAYMVWRIWPLVRRAHARGGMVCVQCTYELPDEDGGNCPECGRPFTRGENRRLWNVPKPSDTVS